VRALSFAANNVKKTDAETIIVRPSRQPVAHQIAPTVAIPAAAFADAIAASRWLPRDLAPGACRATIEETSGEAARSGDGARGRKRSAPARILATRASPRAVSGMCSGAAPPWGTQGAASGGRRS